MLRVLSKALADSESEEYLLSEDDGQSSSEDQTGGACARSGSGSARHYSPGAVHTESFSSPWPGGSNQRLPKRVGYMVWDAGKLQTPRKVTVLAENETSNEGEAGGKQCRQQRRSCSARKLQ